MKRTLISFAVLGTILGAVSAQAGGFDRSGQDTSIILKEGSLLEVTSVSVKPKVTGTYGLAVMGGAITDVAPDYSFTTLAFRTDISDDMALAIIQDEPFGAEVNWTSPSVASASGIPAYALASYNGVKAKIKSSAITALVSYDAVDNITVYGGLKSQSLSATASNPLVSTYTIASNTDSSMGYVMGAAFEKPEIAMRVAFTYHSKIGHDLSIVESFVSGSTTVTAPAKNMSFDTPEAFNLDFQTGIAANTLLFGTIRQVKWKQFNLRPTVYNQLTTPGVLTGATVTATSGKALKEFTSNATTYSIGLGRKFTDQWSGAVTYGTEAAEGVEGGPLGPTDGFSKMGVGVTYTGEKATVTLGVQQVNIGDISLASGDTLKAEMSGNTSLVTAVKVGYKF
jgi:long-chain fatty acid transport protein